MIIRLFRHARSNLIAYTALVLSTLGMAGGAYAALAVPPNSVGTLQLRNHSITPIKLNPRYIGGSIRHWAQVDAKGHIVASSNGAHIKGAVPFIGLYPIDWSDKFSSHCAALVTPRSATVPLPGPPVGYGQTSFVGSPNPTVVWVETYNPQGQPTPMGFSVTVIC
jgi:hypothetical protein